MEHRLSPRIQCRFPVEVRCRQYGNCVAMVQNLSQDGILLDTGDRQLPEGRIIQLYFPAGPGVRDEREVDGLVVHSAPGTGRDLVRRGQRGRPQPVDDAL